MEAKVRYVVEMRWHAGEIQYEPLELLELLREAVGMDGYDIEWYSCALASHAPQPTERDKLIELLKRISTDIGQTIIEDPIRAADGWAMLSEPVIKDIQAAIEPYTNAASAVAQEREETGALTEAWRQRMEQEQRERIAAKTPDLSDEVARRGWENKALDFLKVIVSDGATKAYYMRVARELMAKEERK